MKQKFKTSLFWSKRNSESIVIQYNSKSQRWEEFKSIIIAYGISAAELSKYYCLSCVYRCHCGVIYDIQKVKLFAKWSSNRRKKHCAMSEPKLTAAGNGSIILNGSGEAYTITSNFFYLIFMVIDRTVQNFISLTLRNNICHVEHPPIIIRADQAKSLNSWEVFNTKMHSF